MYDILELELDRFSFIKDWGVFELKIDIYPLDPFIEKSKSRKYKKYNIEYIQISHNTVIFYSKYLSKKKGNIYIINGINSLGHALDEEKFFSHLNARIYCSEEKYFIDVLNSFRKFQWKNVIIIGDTPLLRKWYKKEKLTDDKKLLLICEHPNIEFSEEN